jgi:hypothetical protein
LCSDFEDEIMHLSKEKLEMVISAEDEQDFEIADQQKNNDVIVLEQVLVIGDTGVVTQVIASPMKQQRRRIRANVELHVDEI